jgi:hypothetical protein
MARIKVNLSLCLIKHYTKKTYQGIEEMALLFHNLTFTLQLLFSQGKSPQYPLDKRLVGPQSQSGYGKEKKIPYPYWELSSL